jgi:taurine dioxygenase
VRRPVAAEVAPQVTQMAATFAAVVDGVDAGAALSADAFARLLEIYHRHRVICLRRQTLSPRQLAEFARRFGELEDYHLADFMVPDVPQVRILSNEIVDGKNVGATNAGMYWHSDLSYRPNPAGATLLYGLSCPPEGGNTLFADMVAAYAALPEEMRRRITGLTTVRDRSYRYNEFYPNRPPLTDAQRAAVPPVEHPLVRVHPVTGAKALYMSAGSCSHIPGMDIDAGRKLIAELEAFATQPRFVYSHAWQAGDLVIWDNCVTLHCATPFDGKQYIRKMHRVQALGGRPISA